MAQTQPTYVFGYNKHNNPSFIHTLKHLGKGQILLSNFLKDIIPFKVRDCILDELILAGKSIIQLIKYISVLGISINIFGNADLCIIYLCIIYLCIRYISFVNLTQENPVSVPINDIKFTYFKVNTSSETKLLILSKKPF